MDENLIEAKIEKKRNRLKNIDYLVEIPELYDFIYSELYDYKLRRNILTNIVRDEENILVLGCGSGLFVREIDQDFNVIYAIDKNSEMLDLCQKRSSCRIVKRDIVNKIDVDRKFSNACMFGNVTAVLTINQIKRLMSNVNKNLSNGGIFLFDFVSDKLDINSNDIIIKGENLNVKRRCEVYPKDNLRMTIDYNINLNNESYNFKEKFTMRTHSKSSLSSVAEEEGFSARLLKNKDYDRNILLLKK